MPDTSFLPANANALIPPATDGVAGGTVNSPDVDERTLRPRNRAISDVAHLFQIISTLEEARREQNEKNARIMAKYNAERPFEQQELKELGMDWVSNFSTKPLASAIDKVSPRLTKAVQSARYLTSAALPGIVEGARDKSQRFRQKVTDVIRSWDGWIDFLNEVAQENAVFGFTSVAWLDEYSWRPAHFRQDSFFVPDGTGQTSSKLQLWIGKQHLMIHEMARFIEDRDAAEAAGWDVDNAVKAINSARPQSIAGAANSSPYTEARTYEDAIRESSVSLSLLSGSKTILVYHVFVPEYDGRVSRYLVDGHAKTLLRVQLDQYPDMSHVVALFSYQQANGKLMGSKGVGRELYELAAAVDRNRNSALDRLSLSGKLLVQGEAKQLNRFAMSVLGSTVLIPANYTLVTQGRIEPNVDAFIALDRQLVGFMDQIAGGVTPKEFTKDRTTASEVNLYAAREEEKRDTLLERFLWQLGKLVTTCQRRIVDPDTEDEDAKDAREELLRYMSQEELELIAARPALRTVDDWTELEAQKIAAFAAAKRQDSLYDQEKLQRYEASALVSEDFADEVMVPSPDPTVLSEQSRQQALENVLLERGEPVPVSPRDNHQVHIEVLKPRLAVVAESLQQPDEQVLAVFEGMLVHWNEHITMAVAAGADKEMFAEDLRQIKESAKQLGELQAAMAVAAEQQQMMQQPPGGEIPAGV